jgi:hypothetical protein
MTVASWAGEWHRSDGSTIRYTLRYHGDARDSLRVWIAKQQRV